MIDYEVYPIICTSAPEYVALVQTCREQLDKQGFVSLKHFLLPQSVDNLVSSVLNLENSAGFYSREHHSVFLEDNIDTSNDQNTSDSFHPRHIQLESSKLLINARDLAPHVSELDYLYQSEAFLTFIKDVLQMNKLYPSTDEYGKYYANIFHVGDGLNYHFDRSEFSISLILQPAEQGGQFQFVPNSREVVETWEEMPFKDLQYALDASSTKSMKVHEPELTAGDLYLFRGQNSLHRVSEVTKGKRINIILTFNTEPDIALNNYTLKKFFGVSR